MEDFAPYSLRNDPNASSGMKDAFGNELKMERDGDKWKVTVRGAWELTFDSEPAFDAFRLLAP